MRRAQGSREVAHIKVRLKEHQDGKAVQEGLHIIQLLLQQPDGLHSKTQQKEKRLRATPATPGPMPTETHLKVCSNRAGGVCIHRLEHGMALGRVVLQQGKQRRQSKIPEQALCHHGLPPHCLLPNGHKHTGGSRESGRILRSAAKDGHYVAAKAYHSVRASQGAAWAMLELTKSPDRIPLGWQCRHLPIRRRLLLLD